MCRSRRPAAVIELGSQYCLRNNQRSVSLGHAADKVPRMHIANGLMHRRSQDCGLGGGLNRKSHAMMSSEIFEKRDFLWDEE